MIKGLLLDIDGTLILSNDAHAKSWVDAFLHFGYSVPYEEMRALIGMGGDKLMPILVPGLKKESEIGKKIIEYRSEIFLKKYIHSIKSAPGSKELVKKLQKCGLKLVIASSAKKTELRDLLNIADLEHLAKNAVTSDDAESSKPDPDIVKAALKKIQLKPDEVLMLGDTPYDIEAAGKCGVKVIALRCGGFSDNELIGAIAMYDDPRHLLKNFDNSPIGCK